MDPTNKMAESTMAGSCRARQKTLRSGDKSNRSIVRALFSASRKAIFLGGGGENTGNTRNSSCDRFDDGEKPCCAGACKSTGLALPPPPLPSLSFSSSFPLSSCNFCAREGTETACACQQHIPALVACDSFCRCDMAAKGGYDLQVSC